MSINDRISALRAAMKSQQIDALIVPSTDPHQSEYVADHWQARAWISGFDGSAGTVVITSDHAGLWTDSRYFLQAEEQLQNSEVELHKLTIPHTAEHLDWLLQNGQKGWTIGVDGWMFSARQIKSLEKKLKAAGMSLNTSHDLVGAIWQDRPALPTTPVQILDVKFAGQTAADKIKSLREKMAEASCGYMVFSTLDDIAWLLNIRGRDIAHSPVNICYFLLGKNEAILFINPEKLTPDIKSHFAELRIAFQPYYGMQAALNALAEDTSCWVNPGSLCHPLYRAIACNKHEAELPTSILKACKNETEIAGIRAAMEYDGVALTRLFRWLERTVHERKIPETEIAEKLAGFRAEQPGYVEESFPAIVGYKGNGAIVHYHAQPETCASVGPEGILLLDSGGQYQQGTTDITRTIALSEPTLEQKQNFTRVLQGHIAIDRLVFPEGTKGGQMDILARQPLWLAGLNYGHGTGHGVGHFLNVHEGPQGIGSGVTGKAAQPFLKGMFTSNEPGFYKTGEYGIRIENLVLCVDGPETDFGKFLRFENLTLFPIDTQLIHFPMLHREEVEWLNNYHAKVYQLLSPHLDADEKAWLENKCQFPSSQN